MERHPIPSIAANREPPVAHKLPYTPPKANFVPLKPEEKLFGSFEPVAPPLCMLPFPEPVCGPQ